MKTQKHTYAVRGLLDWKAVLRAGSASITVHFTGGAITKFGIVPAEFTTTDQAISRIIEMSEPFKRGRIFKIN